MPILESLAIGGAIGKGALGLIQGWKSLRKGRDRPEYKVPGAFQEAVTTARSLTQGTRPGREVAEESIRQTTANAVNASRASSNNSAELLAAISASNKEESQAMRNQDALDAQFQTQMQGNLQRALSQQGREQARAFDINEMQPFIDEQQTKARLGQAAISNFFTGFDDLGTIFGNRDLKGVTSDTKIYG